MKTRTEPIKDNEVDELKGRVITISKTAFIRSCARAKKELSFNQVYHNIGRPVKYTDAQIDNLHKERIAGFDVKDIAERSGIPLRTVYWYLREGKTNE